MYNKKSIIKQCVGITSATVLMTMAVTPSISHAAVQNTDQVASGQQLGNQDKVRQITRTIQIDDPYKGMQTIQQTVTFKKVANKWQAVTPSYWLSFFVPNYDEFEPNVYQVQFQPVTINDQNQTVNIKYHQYHVPERQELVDYRQSFYGYDQNFKFNGRTWNAKSTIVGQWYDLPPAPNGFEYLHPEGLPKRLKLYQTTLGPYKLLIQPVQKIDGQVVNHDNELEKEGPDNNQQQPEVKEEQVQTNGEATSSESQTEQEPTSDDGTQTELAKNEGQQTERPDSKEQGVQSDQNNKDGSTQTIQPEIVSQNNQSTQTDATSVTENGNQTGLDAKDQESQTEQSQKDNSTQTDTQPVVSQNSHSTQTESNSKDQVTQTEKAERDASSQTEASTVVNNNTQTESTNEEQSTQTEGISVIDESTQVEENEQPQIYPEKGSQSPEEQVAILNNQITSTSSPNYSREPSLIKSDSAVDENNSPVDSTELQKILDQDSAELKKLSSDEKSHRNKNGKITDKLPQTGNQTDNRTTLMGVLITGIVTAVTTLFWQKRQK
ncbi:MAG: hypothetical protein LKJ51_06530 [Limosilactobacillus sp.]|jgi:hypothetical protein|uniref:hypothetical protein n=1 Tax=Limosilactobacillus sp. TaxID=2773925 RepID=UPI0025C67D05|nr:hypothetical protein [Limosilactobacillus sp.]MCI1975556.1 hypothetical protein [Limosilactobacillus sp.]MCI2031281.1 hypothetical protein [Limosilactobacillus sp.]